MINKKTLIIQLTPYTIWGQWDMDKSDQIFGPFLRFFILDCKRRK